MTTIAYRNGVLAADTQAENCGWVIPGGARKIRRINSDTAAAICGDWALFEPWLHWQCGDDDKPFDLGENTRIILANAAEGVTVYEGRGWFKFDGPFGAWGSGWPAAVAAMHMGADAKRAVEIAALCDPSTGGDVQVMAVASQAVAA